MSVNINEIEKLAKLTRLVLGQAEKKKFSEDISSVLQYFSKLQEVRAEDIEAAEIEAGSLRDDKVVGIGSDEQQELINMAPSSEDGLIKTRAVFK